MKFNSIYNLLKHLVNTNKITQSLYKSQVNYLQCGGGVFSEIKKMYKVDYKKEQYILL